MFSYLVALFFSAFTSATLLPGSSEIVLLAMLNQGTVNAGILVFVATLGNVIGSVFNWVLGRFFQRFRTHKWFPVNPDAYAKAEVWYAKYGFWSLLLAWVPIIGDPITLVAGALRISLLQFVVLVTLSKAARYIFIAWGFIWWSSNSVA